MRVRNVVIDGETAIEFPTKCLRFMVKNFSSNDILVSFVPNPQADEFIKIKRGMGQVVVDNINLNSVADYQEFAHSTIYINGSGEVEVQQLCYL